MGAEAEAEAMPAEMAMGGNSVAPLPKAISASHWYASKSEASALGAGG